METPDILFDPEFFDAPERLMAALLEEVVWDERMRARKTACLGLPYNYSGMTYQEQPFVDGLLPLLDALEERIGFRPNSCLLNLYSDGSSRMGFHADSLEELEVGTGVAIVSLGATRVLEYQLQVDRSITHEVMLAAGSLLYMDDDVQHRWVHGILADPSIEEPRISCTFRRLR